MTARRWLLVAAVMVAGFAATLVVASRSSDDDDDAGARRPGVSLDDLDVPEGPAKELITLVERGRDVAHHAVYEQSGGDRIEVWIDGDRVREEVVAAGGDRRLVLRTEEHAVDCVQSDEAWSCGEPVAEPGAGVQTSVDQLVADLVGAEVTARGETIASREARCFSVTTLEDPVEICLTLEGALARLALGDQRLELVSFELDVDPTVFEPPT